ncbi:MAG: hypothetical protein COV09_01830 [Candidatus Vogelbacteria bacterium CG10_big_fil_rev_8_21_14_0_10_50_13]|uniref:Uncharacterized protein n=1 Tax=Candidatus Vogelbacteria bacterium CG10_big_fil_rev_8_21_14_0_10_50_13 TaxID=1975044 RepID=A0A2H0RHX1_9BACT|nr:MAG: hypothetical protein COV09_01830 [Candidatus Vogelbacteria bacterium CG10_big_fil_rev_8_21_14_0_10_50_13]
MKKALVILLALMMVVAMSGCPSGTNPPPAKTNDLMIVNNSNTYVDTIIIFTDPTDVDGSGQYYYPEETINPGEYFTITGFPDDVYYLYAWRTASDGQSVEAMVVTQQPFWMAGGEMAIFTITKMNMNGGEYNVVYSKIKTAEYQPPAPPIPPELVE